MKRAAILLCLLLLTGCGSDAVPAIEEEAWQMTTVQSTADNGAIIACAPGEPGAPDTAERLTLVCTASDGVLTLTGSMREATGLSRATPGPRSTPSRSDRPRGWPSRP